MAEFNFIVTPYRGYEDEILRLRNRNRPLKQNRAYIDWRYLGQKTQSSPEIFWIKTSNGEFIGMASLIYRPYWIGSKRYEFMVVGDISLDKEYRGTGLADKFIFFIQKQIKQKTSPCALVIPNTAARKVNSRNGWIEKDRFIHHVLLLRPEKKIHDRVRIKAVSSILSTLYLLVLKRKLRAARTDGLTLNFNSAFSEKFDTFWKTFEKKNLFTRDRTFRSLRWRYRNHPGGDSFTIVTCHHRQNFVAYLVYAINAEYKSVTIYDLMAIREKYICGFMKLFIDSIKKNDIDSVRIPLNKSHPYSDQVKKIGFSARKGGQSIQVIIPDHTPVEFNQYRWALTAGDKDV